MSEICSAYLCHNNTYANIKGRPYCSNHIKQLLTTLNTEEIINYKTN